MMGVQHILRIIFMKDLYKIVAKQKQQREAQIYRQCEKENICTRDVNYDNESSDDDNYQKTSSQLVPRDYVHIIMKVNSGKQQKQNVNQNLWND